MAWKAQTLSQPQPATVAQRLRAVADFECGQMYHTEPLGTVEQAGTAAQGKGPAAGGSRYMRIGYQTMEGGRASPLKSLKI